MQTSIPQPDRSMSGISFFSSSLPDSSTTGTPFGRDGGVSGKKRKPGAQMNGDLEDEMTVAEVPDFKSVEDRWQILVLNCTSTTASMTDDRLDVTDSPGDLRNT